jgi:hypothetical protein
VPDGRIAAMSAVGDSLIHRTSKGGDSRKSSTSGRENESGKTSGLKPLMQSAAAFRDFTVMKQDLIADSPDASHLDVVLVVMGSEPIQKAKLPVNGRMVTLAWNQPSFDIKQLWSLSFEITIIWFV